MTNSRSCLVPDGSALMVGAFLVACALALLCETGGRVCAVSAAPAEARGGWQEGRVELRLRSFTSGASGRLSIEPTTSGGRARLTALGLPSPSSLSPMAHAFVAWATGNGRVVRLGELKTDARGNGGLEFAHPSSFERYGVIVTAETNAEAEKLAGTPVLATRAGEAAALFAPAAATGGDDTSVRNISPPAGGAAPGGKEPRKLARPRRLSGGDFYMEVDGALAASGGGRLIELEGGEVAPRASGRARVAAHSGTAFVRALFRDLPLPSTVGANTYVLWAVASDGRIIYMGSLPAGEEITKMEIYVRVEAEMADDFYLFVTAENSRPQARPSGRRALVKRQGAGYVK